MKRMTRRRTQTEETTAETIVEDCKPADDDEESDDVLHSVWPAWSEEQVVVLVR